MSYCKECPNWKHSKIRPNYCAVFDWLSEADDFCSFEDREPQPKKGKWENIVSYVAEYQVRNEKKPYEMIEALCSVCNRYADFTESRFYSGLNNFCPHCGADMRGTEDES